MIYDIIKYIVNNIGFLFLIFVAILSATNALTDIVHKWRLKHE